MWGYYFLLTDAGNMLMERLKQTTVDAENTQGFSQPPMVKRTRINCRLASVRPKLVPAEVTSSMFIV